MPTSLHHQLFWNIGSKHFCHSVGAKAVVCQWLIQFAFKSHRFHHLGQLILTDWYCCKPWSTGIFWLNSFRLQVEKMSFAFASAGNLAMYLSISRTWHLGISTLSY